MAAFNNFKCLYGHYSSKYYGTLKQKHLAIDLVGQKTNETLNFTSINTPEPEMCVILWCDLLDVLAWIPIYLCGITASDVTTTTRSHLLLIRMVLILRVFNAP